jgi:hypothetical protein
MDGAPRCRRIPLRNQLRSFRHQLIRLKEMAPDLPFTEQFTWSPGQIEVSVNFWADEAVLAYSIGAVAPCPCRDR